MYYLRARYYDPEVGRFISEDTNKGKPDDPMSLNLYVYCKGNPIRYVDPTGHSGTGVAELFYSNPIFTFSVGLAYAFAVEMSPYVNMLSSNIDKVNSLDAAKDKYSDGNNSPNDQEPPDNKNKKNKPDSTKHSDYRKNVTGRPVGTSVSDILNALNKPSNILTQDNGNIIIKGSNGRIQVLSPDGLTQITTLVRTSANVQSLIRQGKYIIPSLEQQENLIKILKMYKN